METIRLADTGLTTTRLGFGGSRLLGGAWRRESRTLLDAALDAGIQHFDTAPMYAEGQAESVLCDFLRSRATHATVATKYGILPPPRGWKTRSFSLARSVARPLLRAVPKVKAQATQVASRIGPSTAKADFTAAQAAGSLERSLRALGVDHVDLFLLHEALPEDLVDDTLLEFLLAQQRSGVIGAFGVGGAASAVPRLLEERPDYCRVMQFDWSILDPRPDTPGFLLHYGVLGRAFGWLRTALAADPALQRRWSNEVDRDLSDDDVLSSLLLKAALEVNPTSIVLVSTRHIRRIQANVEVAEDQAEAQPALRLWELVRSEQLLHGI